MMEQKTFSDIINHEEPIKLADNIWWVGHMLPGDPFQCHVYLIENGDESVLIDPGSVLTFDSTLRKIEKIIPFDNIKYFLCQHQDPDITGSLPIIDKMITRDDATIVSHWRAITLMKHYGLKLPFMCVEKNNWVLELKDRQLEFILTPYLHFPGAFGSFDRKSGIFFSSDLFGGFTEEWSLFAQDENYFESMRPFHEHYMPSRDILLYSMNKIEKYPIKMIAPQHGSIIPEHLIEFIINQLKELDCGLYLMVKNNSDIIRLSKLNKLLRGLMESITYHRDFSVIVKLCFKQIQEVIPAMHLDFYVESELGHISKIDTVYRMGKSPHDIHLPPELNDIFGITEKQWLDKFTDITYENELKMDNDLPKPREANQYIAIPLFLSDNKNLFSVAIIYLKEYYELGNETRDVLSKISLPLSIVVEREMIHRKIEIEKEKFYNQSIRDSLTNLYTRTYMKESVQRLVSIHNRNPEASVGVIAMDIDHFKIVNDTYGHSCGDMVLKEISKIIFESTRQGDIPVRMGGEEFAIFIVCNDIMVVYNTAERIRKKIEQMSFEGKMEHHEFSSSFGVVIHNLDEEISDTLNRADYALYEAKSTGRNKVCTN